MFRFDRRMFQYLDWPLLFLTLLIPMVGLGVQYSAGYDADGAAGMLSWLPFPFRSPVCARQAVFFLIGIGTMLLGMIVPSHVFQRSAYFLYVLAAGLLLAVLYVGIVVNGSRRWLWLGGINIQPAELMKLAVILTMARFVSRNPPERASGYSLFELFVPSLIILIPMLMIMRQPDLGTALALGIVGFSMILFIGIRRRTIISLFLTVAVLAVPVWRLMHDYQQRRILVLFDPTIDPQGSGYHIIQSKIAVGSGAVFGKGFLQGTQTQLEFLPEHTTDFIFSVLAEEWGFVGCLLVILLFAFLILTIVRISANMRDVFGTMVAFGVATQFLVHVVVNIGMVIGILPIVGIPLPMFSYGGSSLITLMFELGMVQGLSMRRTVFNTR